MALGVRRCSSQTLLHVSIGSLLVLVHLFQSCVLNYYIISPNKDSLIAYFWFALDLIVMFVFIGTLTIAHQYLRCKNRDKLQRFAFSPKRLIARYPRSHLGVLPLSYLSWLLYALVLVAKITVIFQSSVPNTISPKDLWGPQLLQIAIASSGALFMLLVEGHHDAEPSSARNTYIRLLCGSTAYEIMDSVQFLSLLIVSKTHVIFQFSFERAILALSTINFLLPTISLYKLSLTDFGLSHSSPLVVATYRLLHLTLVNLSYLAVRVYLWHWTGGDISMFLMKNMLGTCTTLYSLYPDLVRMCCGGGGGSGACCGPDTAGATDADAQPGLELDQVSTGATPVAPTGQADGAGGGPGAGATQALIEKQAPLAQTV